MIPGNRRPADAERRVPKAIPRHERVGALMPWREEHFGGSRLSTRSMVRQGFRNQVYTAERNQAGNYPWLRRVPEAISGRGSGVSAFCRSVSVRHQEQFPAPAAGARPGPHRCRRRGCDHTRHRSANEPLPASVTMRPDQRSIVSSPPSVKNKKDNTKQIVFFIAFSPLR